MEQYLDSFHHLNINMSQLHASGILPWLHSSVARWLSLQLVAAIHHLLAQGLQICEITHNCTICEYSMIPQNVGLALNFADASHALKILQSQS